MDKQTFIKVLENTLSLENILRQEAEDLLRKLSQEKPYGNMLLDVLGDVTVDKSMRLAACLLFKALVNSTWRLKDSIIESEKVLFREKLLLILENRNDLEMNVLKDNISRVIGKIARNDYPNSWPTLITRLIDLFEKSNESTLKGYSLNTIKHVYNQLASKRLGNRDAFNSLSIEFFKYFTKYWELSSQSIQNLSNNLQSLNQGDLSLFYLISKILRRVLQCGFNKYQESKEITAFFRRVLEFTGHLIPKIIEQQQEQLSWIILIHQKIIIRSFDNEPLQFVNFLPSTLEYFTNQILYYQISMEPILGRSIVQSINHLKSVVDCKAYQQRALDDYDEDGYETIPIANIKDHDKGKSENIIEIAQKQILSFFDYKLLSKLLKALVSNLLIISKDELVEWEESPEIYYVEADAKKNDAANTLKGSAYEYFIALMKHFHQDSFTIVREMLDQVTSESNTSAPISDQLVLLKESCYMTIGLGYSELYDKINFSMVFQNLFLQELRSTDVRYKIIKRRILWLMSYWSDIPETLRDTVVQVYLEFLNSNDLVICLTTADSLRAYIDDYQFSFEEYSKYIDHTFKVFLNLFQATQEDDSKVNLLSVLSSIFLKFQENIKPYSSSILSLFSSLWDNGNSSELLQVSIIRSLSFFIQALNRDPSEIFSILVPIITYSTSNSSSLLLEDGLDLWFHTMCRVSCIHPEIVNLFPQLIDVLDRVVDHFEICLKILDTYMMVGRDDLFRNYGTKIADSLFLIVDGVIKDQTSTVIKPVSRILQIYPNEGPILLASTLKKLLSIILDDQETELIVIIEYLSIFSRLLTMNPMAFLSLFENNSERLNRFLTLYLENLDSIATSDQRKLAAIALSNLLPIKINEITPLIPTIITYVVGMRPDINQNEFNYDYLEDGNKLPDFSAVDIQNSQIQKSDPLNLIDLQTYLSTKINEASNVYGSQIFQNILQSIDKTILELAFPK